MPVRRRSSLLLLSMAVAATVLIVWGINHSGRLRGGHADSAGGGAEAVLPAAPAVNPGPASTTEGARPVPRFEVPAGAPDRTLAVFKDETQREGEIGYDLRLKYVQTFKAFVKEAGLTAVQEERFRTSLAEMQGKLVELRTRSRQQRAQLLREALRRGEPPPRTGRQEYEEQDRLQVELQQRAQAIVNPSQFEMLGRSADYVPLKLMAGLGAQPFETAR